MDPSRATASLAHNYESRFSSITPVSEPDKFTYRESLKNIVIGLQQRSNMFEIELAKIFTIIFKYEKQVEALKVALFRQEEIRNADETHLFNTLFRSIDSTMSTRLNASDIQAFVTSRLPDAHHSRECYLSQIWLYAG